MTMVPLVFKKSFAVLIHMNPWTWIAALFGAQSFGAILVAHGFGVDVREVAIPILLLIFGSFLAAYFRLSKRSATWRAWKWWWPAIVYALFIFFLSNRSYPDAHVSFDTKLFHPVEYMTLGIFLCCLWRDVLKEKGIPSFLMRVLLAGFFYGMMDEFHQAFIPGRSARLLDVFIDLMGATGGCALFLAVGRVQSTFKKRLDSLSPLEFPS